MPAVQTSDRVGRGIVPEVEALLPVLWPWLDQLTWKANYARFGHDLGIDLVGNPDRALDPDVSAAVFADFFHSKGCYKEANESDWVGVRRRVNGGTNGLNDFLVFVTRLQAAQNSVSRL